MPIRTVLVANRGEVARRIARTCRDHGMRVVAVFVPDDAGAAFVAEADVAVPVPSYLDGAAIVAAAVATGADAVHPGYGFLSENATFARAVVAAGLVFVGPPAAVVELMGRKDRARAVAERAGVAVVPQYAAEAVPADAFPVLVKAAAGGGGKGMRVARGLAELPDAVAAARREALAAFGDGTLVVEPYLEAGRHLEVQVVADDHGAVLHLGTRDCSAQRRHQKVVEEAPAPGLPAALEREMLDEAVALARAVGYRGVGTVEFLVVGDAAWFLEMNTRLQVEHPVTEAVTGVDLVAWQLTVAAGEPLPAGQDDVRIRGHAIEVRVCAEDPAAGFLPQTGRIDRLVWPDGVRVEADLAVGREVGTAFDPLLAKLVVAGADREDARRRLVGALDRTVLRGVGTNLGFLRRLIASPEFTAGPVSTDWLDGPSSAAVRHRPDPPAVVLRQATAAWLDRYGPATDGPLRPDGWRLGRPVEPAVPWEVVDGPERTDEVVVGHEAETWRLARPDPMRRDRTRPGRAGGDVVAPMPGTVVVVDVADGEAVVAGQRIAAVEAMKMEHALCAPRAGTVTRLGVAVGGRVERGDLVAVVAP